MPRKTHRESSAAFLNGEPHQRPAAAESAETGIAHQEREEVCAGAMLEDDVGKVLLRAAVAGGNGALLIVDPIHLHRADRVGRPRSQKIGTRDPFAPS